MIGQQKVGLTRLLSLLPFVLALACGAPERVDLGSVTSAASSQGAGGESPLGVQQGSSRYPVLLHHGFLGFDRILSVDYFYGVRERLESEGFLVKSTRVSPANTIAYRARQLAGQVDALLARTGAAKVNIIAHSMGGLDARYLISTLGYGDRVASLTMISTPNGGSALADLALDLDDARQEAAIGLWRAVVGTPQDRDAFDIPGVGELDLWAALRDLGTGARIQRFNARNPDDSRVYYQSFAGITSATGITTGDIVTPLLSVGYVIEQALEGDNDGVVSVDSSVWGHYRGEIPADHLNEVGQPFGATSWLYDHRDFYAALAHEFAARGF